MNENKKWWEKYLSLGYWLPYWPVGLLLLSWALSPLFAESRAKKEAEAEAAGREFQKWWQESLQKRPAKSQALPETKVENHQRRREER